MRALNLCLITRLPRDISLTGYLDSVQQALQAGVTSLQLRDKTHTFAELTHCAFALKELLASWSVPLIINDNLALAERVNADGVHLGQSDGSVIQARNRLGADKIIGLSIESLEDLKLANSLDCLDYVAASAVFFSASKPYCKHIWGLQGLQKLVRLSHYPVVGIGDINSSNARAVMRTGACGVAVIRAIHDSADWHIATTALLREIHKGEDDVRQHTNAP